MSIMGQFSKRLKTLREGVGLNQSQLAEKLGVSRGSISYYENGERVPDIDFLYRVSKYFDVSFDFLFGEKSGKEKSLEDKLSLSSEAIDAIEVLSRTIDLKTGLSLADVLNSLLLNPRFSDLLCQIGAAANMDEQEANELSALSKSLIGLEIAPTLDAAERLREAMILSVVSGIIDDLKNNPITSHYSIEKVNDGVKITKKSDS